VLLGLEEFCIVFGICVAYCERFGTKACVHRLTVCRRECASSPRCIFTHPLQITYGSRNIAR